MNSPSAPEVEFSVGALLASMRGHREALQEGKKLTMRVTKLKLPAPAPKLKPRDISSLRTELKIRCSTQPP